MSREVVAKGVFRLRLPHVLPCEALVLDMDASRPRVELATPGLVLENVEVEISVGTGGKQKMVLKRLLVPEFRGRLEPVFDEASGNYMWWANVADEPVIVDAEE